ncbi:MAG: T9SS type A sorting domain-containing protein [Flavobacteriales bacterium]|nr:T9SS type A sorting domain-containing protein [Flavobacteriales bacterium]MBK7269642.1 T9SS type A sorting domain-containing protein [Flavobacteriales bacterium]MBK9074672.1 T9SS type A sorting domain-containing protein [Flavobacteriales bacterium]
MMHRSFSALLMLTAFAPTQAQTVQKCCGSSNSTFLLGNLATANHSQCLYLPTDLTGATDGEITRIYYRYGTTGQTSGNTLTNFMVRMTQTSATAFVGGDTFFTGLDTVLTRATFTIAPGTTGDWFVIPLDSAFTFDASLTLVVDISFTGSATTNFGTYSTNLAGRKLYWNDLTSPTGESVVTTWQDIGFDLAPTTGVVDHFAAAPLLPYPNPTISSVQLAGAAPNTPFQLIHTDGRILRSGTLSPEGIDMNGLDPGLYFVGIPARSGWRYSAVVKE